MEYLGNVALEANTKLLAQIKVSFELILNLN
jgi:hypothetical protein